MSTTPIADYALLSDRHSAALVSRDGSIDWLCFPRFDSSSVLGRLLGDKAGHWSIRASNATQVTRRYLDRTMVLETTFRTPTGTVSLQTPWPWATETGGMNSARVHRIFCCDVRRALKEKSSCLWSTSRAPSTDWSIPSSTASTVGWLHSGVPTFSSSLLLWP